MARRMVIVSVIVAVGIACGAFAQQPAPGTAKQGQAKAKQPPARRATLLFREEWKQGATSGEHAVAGDSVANPNLELKLYGPAAKEIQLAGPGEGEDTPLHLWTGLCTTPCGFALSDKNNYADLTGLARIRLVTKTSGFHQVRPIVKLADATWLVGNRTDGTTVDWIESEFAVSDVRWLHLDIERAVTTGTWVDKPDLGKVDEIGFVDLMPSSGHGQGGWADVGKIEVYGKPVKR